MRENIRTEERPDGIIPGPETFYKIKDPIKDPFSVADIGVADTDYELLLEVIE